MKMNKGFTVGMVICFVAVIAYAGTVLFYPKEEKPNQARQEDVQKEPETQDVSNEKVQNEEPQKEEKEEKKPIVQEPVNESRRLAFSKTNVLSWPVDGHVILSYSMDQTVYFSTLDQYKYNPAMLIGGEVGASVIAAADGIVTDVSENVETGLTVTVELGNGYEAIYGQLMEVTVSPGEYIDQEESIGKLAEPSRYYTVEGPNLYFQLLKDGEPENPMEYMDV